jgi:hypothetical protein
MKETLELASAPYGERCAQVGTEEYGLRARAECLAYRGQLLRAAAAEKKEVPAGVTFYTKGSGHDFGTYYEVALRFDSDVEAEADFAAWLDGNQPEKWDAIARVELGLPEPTDESD